MDWMQFVSSLAGSLAWPAASVIIVLQFRKSLGRRLAALLSLTLPGGIEAKFANELSEVTPPEEMPVPVPVPAQVGSAQPIGEQSTPPVRPMLSTAPIVEDGAVESILFKPDQRSLKANPTGVVMESWKTLETVLRLVHERKYPEISSTRFSIFPLIRRLSVDGFLSKDDQENLRRLNAARNLAAHSTQPISAENANDFADIASSMSNIFMSRLNADLP